VLRGMCRTTSHPVVRYKGRATVNTRTIAIIAFVIAVIVVVILLV
jgi:hypothetical protein